MGNLEYSALTTPLFSTEKKKKKKKHCYVSTVNKADLKFWENLHPASCLQSWKTGSCCADNLEHPDGPGSLLRREQLKTKTCFSFSGTIHCVSPHRYLNYIKILFLLTFDQP